MTTIREVIQHLEAFAPLAYQESYDNCGLLTGDKTSEVKGALITLDTTEEVVQEAISKNCNLIISHHPIIFGGLKSLTGKNYVERTIIAAIKNDVAIYAIHTNLDNVSGGVNHKICEKLGLSKTKILAPKADTLCKLTTFIPKKNTEEVLQAIHQAGVGAVGEYDHCSFTVDGVGRFRPLDNANPHIGEAGGDVETVEEHRVEVIFPCHLWDRVYTSLTDKHPYDEVAYYLHTLANPNQRVGSGMIGELSREMAPVDFLKMLKQSMNLSLIRHTDLQAVDSIKKVAVCGGSGSFLIPQAKSQGVDIFVTGDVKYHDFFDAEGQLIIADIGHYESEVFTKELLADLLSKNFNTFATNLAKEVTNPIRYY